jgi:type I restriction enzyme S subunit
VSVAIEAYDEMMRLELPVLDDILFLSEAPLGTVALVDRDDIVRAQGRVLSSLV